MIASINATLACLKISQREFPNIHGKHNKANAFRHALWNVLIAKECAKFSRNLKGILNWTQKITDWHEEFSPNQALEKMMDLHNNQYGRNFYKKHQEISTIELIHQLKKELNIALQININTTALDTGKMVYLEP